MDRGESPDVRWILAFESLEQKAEGKGSDGAAGVSALTKHWSHLELLKY